MYAPRWPRLRGFRRRRILRGSTPIEREYRPLRKGEERRHAQANMRQMDRHALLLLCLRESALDPFLDPFGQRSERLVGGDVGPGRSALHALGIAETDRASVDLRGLKRFGNLL